MFKLEIELGNDAMRLPHQVARALNRIAVSLRDGEVSGKVHDDNGNKVGRWSFKAPKDED